MKKRTRFEKLARGCFALSLSLAEWLELEQILLTSRKARRIFRQRASRRSLHGKPRWIPLRGTFRERVTG